MQEKTHSRFIRKPELCALIGLCPESIRLMELRQEFPKRIRLDAGTGRGRSVAWDEAEVLQWMEARRAHRAPTPESKAA